MKCFTNNSFRRLWSFDAGVVVYVVVAVVFVVVMCVVVADVEPYCCYIYIYIYIHIYIYTHSSGRSYLGVQPNFMLRGFILRNFWVKVPGDSL